MRESEHTTERERGIAPLTAEDAARLHMESARNPMTITIVLELEGRLEHARVVQRVEQRLLSEPRMRAHVEERALRVPRWVPHQALDVRRHVHRVGLAAPRDDDALRALVSDLASTPLDPRRPLWDLHVVEDAPSGTALVLRVHHALADGLALVRLLGRLADEDASAPSIAAPPRPGRWIERIAPLLSMARFVASRPDPDTILRSAPSEQKTLAWTRACSLSKLRDQARASGASFSTWLLAVTAGALRRVLIARGALEPALELRAMVPVSVRDDDDATGNRFVSVFVPLPLGLEDPSARIAALRARESALHRPAAIGVGRGLVALAGRGSASLEERAVARLSRKASVLVSSVPGPTGALSIDGHRVRAAIGFAPVAGALSLGITYLGCGDALHAGVVRGAREAPSALEVVRAIEDELELLCSGAC